MYRQTSLNSPLSPILNMHERTEKTIPANRSLVTAGLAQLNFHRISHPADLTSRGRLLHPHQIVGKDNWSPGGRPTENGGHAWALLSQHIQAGPLGQRQQFCPAGDIWLCLETVWVVTTEEGQAVGVLWVEGRDAAKYPTMHRQVLKQRDLS